MEASDNRIGIVDSDWSYVRHGLDLGGAVVHKVSLALLIAM
jgi:hypothetical protein